MFQIMLFRLELQNIHQIRNGNLMIAIVTKQIQQVVMNLKEPAVLQYSHDFRQC
jgi:hypothetical protein